VTPANGIGSDLHFYRGTEGPATGFTLGHELLGEIVDVGKGIQKFKKGDLVIAPFSLSCGELPTPLGRRTGRPMLRM
jgi:glutathione-independent formaldehyde dehydrogenase